MEQQQVEAVLPEAIEAALGRHPQVGGVFVRAAQLGVGEARIAARALALSLVEVVADGADQAVSVARHPVERPPEQRVRLTGPVRVRGQDRVDAVAGAQQSLEALGLDRLAEAEEPPAAPGSDRLRPGGDMWRTVA